MTIAGTVADWERWAEHVLPGQRRLRRAGALTLVSIDREADRGLYVEPNVWMLHPL